MSIITIDAKDPDELIQKDAKAWQKAIEQAKYAPDWLVEHYKKALDLSSAQGKRAFTDALLATIRRLGDSVEQEHYLKLVAKTADTSIEAVRSKLAAGGAAAAVLPRKKPAPGIAQLDKSVIEQQKLQDHFLAMVLMQPKIRDLLEEMKPEYFSEGPPRIVLEFLQKNPDFKGQPQTAAQLHSVVEYVKIIGLQFEELYQDLPLDDLKEQAARLKNRAVARYVNTQKTKLAQQMQYTTDAVQVQKLMEKANQLNTLIKMVED